MIDLISYNGELNRLATNNFIQEVFNYYNGRINFINTNLILNIEYIINHKDYGVFNPPCYITIYPLSIYTNIINDMYVDCEATIAEKNNYLKQFILSTVIHELYHADQDVYGNYTHINIGIIEQQVELMTNYYIANHINDFSRFGITPLYDYKYIANVYLNTNEYYKFDRITNRSHIANFFKFICSGNDAIAIGLCKLLYFDLPISIYLNLNNQEICLIDNYNNCINTSIFNSFIINNLKIKCIYDCEEFDCKVEVRTIDDNSIRISMYTDLNNNVFPCITKEGD